MFLFLSTFVPTLRTEQRVFAPERTRGGGPQPGTPAPARIPRNPHHLRGPVDLRSRPHTHRDPPPSHGGQHSRVDLCTVGRAPHLPQDRRGDGGRHGGVSGSGPHEGLAPGTVRSPARHSKGTDRPRLRNGANGISDPHQVRDSDPGARLPGHEIAGANRLYVPAVPGQDPGTAGGLRRVRPETGAESPPGTILSPLVSGGTLFRNSSASLHHQPRKHGFVGRGAEFGTIVVVRGVGFPVAPVDAGRNDELLCLSTADWCSVAKILQGRRSRRRGGGNPALPVPRV